MPIKGPWFITRAALEDFARLTGEARAAPDSRSELDTQIASAHFVRLNDDGSEVWRGGKPLRLRFIVRTGAGVGGDAPQLVRVEGDHAGRAAPRARAVTLWDGAQTQTFQVTDEVHDPGPQRRVAYRQADGTWVVGERGRTRPDHVVIYPDSPLKNAPGWVREQRGQKPRRGGKNQ